MIQNSTDTAMTRAQVEALTACMWSTAHVDGVHPQEDVLIRRFYDEQATAGTPTFEAFTAGKPDANALLAAARGNAEFAEQLVLMCLMTGYADGQLSDAERTHVDGIAKQAGVSDARVAELLLQVKDSLIGALAHLPDSESVAALAKTL